MSVTTNSGRQSHSETKRMPDVTIRDLDDAVIARIRTSAHRNGHSVTEEIRQILTAADESSTVPTKGLGTAIHELFKPLGGVELESPLREMMRAPPAFE